MLDVRLRATGGAISNLYAVLCARQKFLPSVKSQGLFGLPRLVMYTSEHVSDNSCIQCLRLSSRDVSSLIGSLMYLTLLACCCVPAQAHFSIKRAGAILGLGTDNVIYLKTDSRYAEANIYTCYNVTDGLLQHTYLRRSVRAQVLSNAFAVTAKQNIHEHIIY